MKILLIVLAMVLAVISCTSSNRKTETSEREVKILPSPAKESSAEPYLFTDKKGTVYLSWIEKSGDENTLKFSTLENNQWSQPVTMASGNNWFVNWADYPMMAADGDEHLVANYLEKSAAGTYAYDVKYITSSDKGKSWSSSKILHDDGKEAEHGFVSIMPYGDRFFISWLDGRNTTTGENAEEHEGHDGQMTLRGAVLNKNGIKENEWELDNRVCDCCQTSVAITANGPVVVYRDRSDDEIRDMSIVRYIKGGWTQPKIIFPDKWMIEGCPVNGPRVDAIGNNVAIAWFSMKDKKGEVKVIFSEDGGATFKEPVQVDEGNPIGRVDIVMLDEKTAMVSWMEQSELKAVKVHADGNKETPVMIASSSESRSSGFPQMTKSGDQLFFSWTDDKEKTIKVASASLSGAY